MKTTVVSLVFCFLFAGCASSFKITTAGLNDWQFDSMQAKAYADLTIDGQSIGTYYLEDRHCPKYPDCRDCPVTLEKGQYSVSFGPKGGEQAWKVGETYRDITVDFDPPSNGKLKGLEIRLLGKHGPEAYWVEDFARGKVSVVQDGRNLRVHYAGPAKLLFGIILSKPEISLDVIFNIQLPQD